jgi:protein TonB
MLAQPNPDFRMNQTSPVISLPLLLTSLVSICLHALLFVGWRGAFPQAAALPRPALSATLKIPEPLPDLARPLRELTLAPPAETAPARPVSRPAPKPVAQMPQDTPLGTLPAAATRSVRQQFEGQQDFYPLEAIDKRLEGEVLVQIFLDEQGHVIAARVAQSSGYPLLDQAALRAARMLRSLPVDGLEEAVLPVRFRLE